MNRKSLNFAGRRIAVPFGTLALAGAFASLLAPGAKAQITSRSTGLARLSYLNSRAGTYASAYGYRAYPLNGAARNAYAPNAYGPNGYAPNAYSANAYGANASLMGRYATGAQNPGAASNGASAQPSSSASTPTQQSSSRLTARFVGPDQLLVEWSGDASGVQQIALGLFDGDGVMLDARFLTRFPVQSVFTMTSTARYYGMQTQYRNGTTSTVYTLIP